VTRSWATVLLWGLFLVVLTAVTAPFDPDIYTYGLLGASALATLAIGALVLGLNGREDRTISRASAGRAVSFPAMLLGVGVSAMALGAVVGWWLSAIGAGLSIVAVGGLVREWREV
jgi:energy-converting hydrogenase Eha subunit A